MKVKLITPWCGPPPEWMPKFLERIEANKLFDWRLIPTHLHELNRLAQKVTGLKCQKEMFYNAACDYRPLYGQIFANVIGDAEWWGWVDLDVVVGDLDRLLGPFLEGHDVVTTDANYLHGPMTILRNSPECLDLWRTCPDAAKVFADPDYWQFDETGFDNPRNPNLTQLVRDAGLRVHWDDRFWTESANTIEDGVPARCCEVRDGRLFETPTGRELVGYHFSLPPKKWPMPHRFSSSIERLAELQRDHLKNRAANPSSPPSHRDENPGFWANRIAENNRRNEPLHKILMDCNEADWNRIQTHSRNVLRGVVKHGDRVLDCGCGYGVLLEVMPFSEYVGVDSCPEMIELARRRNPRFRFELADLRHLPFADDFFDVAVCRSVEGTVKTRVSNRDWAAMRQEMLRVARKLVLIDMNRHHRVVERT